MLAAAGNGGLVIALVSLALTALLSTLGFIVVKVWNISDDVSAIKTSVKAVEDEHCGLRLNTVETYLWPPGPPRQGASR